MWFYKVKVYFLLPSNGSLSKRRSIYVPVNLRQPIFFDQKNAKSSWLSLLLFCRILCAGNIPPEGNVRPSVSLLLFSLISLNCWLTDEGCKGNDSNFSKKNYLQKADRCWELVVQESGLVFSTVHAIHLQNKMWLGCAILKGDNFP